MSTTSALTDYDTALKAVQDALATRDFDTADLQCTIANAALARLEQRLTTGSVDKTRRNDLNRLQESIARARANSQATTDNRRMISTRLSF